LREWAIQLPRDYLPDGWDYLFTAAAPVRVLIVGYARLLREKTQNNCDCDVNYCMRFFRAWRRQMRDLSSVETKILAVEGYRRALRRLPV